MEAPPVIHKHHTRSVSARRLVPPRKLPPWGALFNLLLKSVEPDKNPLERRRVKTVTGTG